MPETDPAADYGEAKFWEFVDSLRPFSFAQKSQLGPAAAPSYDPKADPEMLAKSIAAEAAKSSDT